MMLRIHSDLYVIADDARAAPARRHRTRIRVGQGNLLIGRGQHLLVDRFQTLHLGRQLGKLLLEVRRLRSEGFRWVLQVGGVELAQIPRHALLDLSKPALHLRAREVLVAVVDRLELAAIDGDARCRQKAYLSANGDELRAHLADRRPVILAEIGDRLVIGNQPTGEPHDLHVATGLTFKPAARLNPIEITVGVELQKDRRTVRRPAGGLGINPAKPKLGQIEPPDKDINHANRIILIDPVFQAFGKQRGLAAIYPLNEALHPIPPQITQESYRENHIDPRVFTQPGSTPSSRTLSRTSAKDLGRVKTAGRRIDASRFWGSDAFGHFGESGAFPSGK